MSALVGSYHLVGVLCGALHALPHWTVRRSAPVVVSATFRVPRCQTSQSLSLCLEYLILQLHYPRGTRTLVKIGSRLDNSRLMFNCALNTMYLKTMEDVMLVSRSLWCCDSWRELARDVEHSLTSSQRLRSLGCLLQSSFVTYAGIVGSFLKDLSKFRVRL